MRKFTKQKKETAIATVFSNKGNCQTQTENFKVSFQYLDTTQKYYKHSLNWQQSGEKTFSFFTYFLPFRKHKLFLYIKT